jgi:hypothetical protein
MELDRIEIKSDSLFLEWHDPTKLEEKHELKVGWNEKFQKKFESVIDLDLGEILIAPLNNLIKEYVLEIRATSKSWTFEGIHGLIGPYKQIFEGENLGLCWTWFTHWSSLFSRKNLTAGERLLCNAIEIDMLSWRNGRTTTIHGGVFAQYGCVVVPNLLSAFNWMRKYLKNAGKTSGILSVKGGNGVFNFSDQSNPDIYTIFVTNDNDMEIESYFFNK